MNIEKERVKDFWNASSCGETLYLKGGDLRDQFHNQLRKRYELEPFIIPFAEFGAWKDKKVLEIGVGLGADHQMFAQHGAALFGVDLTERAIDRTSQRLKLFDLKSSLQVADAEDLPFGNEKFDLVYSWGVVHHSPDTPKAVDEIYRVLKNGGKAKVMIYHKRSMIGYMLWLRYALLKFKPYTSFNTLYAKYLESPGTKAYSVEEAKSLFSKFGNVVIDTVLTHGDLLDSDAGQRHSGVLLDIARKIYPRSLVKRLFSKHGLFMLIGATKS